MLIILATWEDEIRRIDVPGQTWQKFVRPHLTGKKQGMVYVPVIPVMSENIKIEEYCGSGHLGQKLRPHLQNNQSKKLEV
jgi:hypothetical protein